MAERTRRSRAAGSKMVGRYCGRPGLYGNPWAVKVYEPTGPQPAGLHGGVIRSGPTRRFTIEGPGHQHGSMLMRDKRYATLYVVQRFHGALAAGQLRFTIDDVRRELAGQDLACYCPLVGSDGRPWPCHVDVLLLAANSPRHTILPPLPSYA